MSQFDRMQKDTLNQGSTFLFTEAYGTRDNSLEGLRDAMFFGAFALLASGSAVLLALGRSSELMASVENALRAL